MYVDNIYCYIFINILTYLPESGSYLQMPYVYIYSTFLSYVSAVYTIINFAVLVSGFVSVRGIATQSLFSLNFLYVWPILVSSNVGKSNESIKMTGNLIVYDVVIVLPCILPIAKYHSEFSCQFP